MSKEVIVSPGYGAGWSTWDEHGKFIAEYKPLIEWLKEHPEPEDRKELKTEWDREYSDDKPKYIHPIIDQLETDLAKELDVPRENISVYTGGLLQAEIVTVSGPYRIDEYDGFENLVLADQQEWW